MSMNHHTPVPAPRPLCAIYKPQLGLLVFGLLDPDQEAALRDHLADCDYCQLHLREYEIVRRALYQHVGAEPPIAGDTTSIPIAPVRSAPQRPPAGETPPHFTLEDIMKADQQKTAAATREPPKPPSPLALARNKRLTSLGAIAAVLVLTVLAVSLFAYFGSRGTAPAVKPTPTRGLDAQSQAYVNVLEKYYQPVGQTYDQEESCLENEGLTTSASTKASVMQSCQALEVTVVNNVHAFADHLTLPPPTRWQTADTQLKQANQAMVTSFTASIQATSVTEWEALNEAEQPAKQSYCAPIKQINGDLLNAGLPISSQLPLPIHAALCPGG